MDPETTSASPSPVDINSAPAEELETLEGIGPALAERIVAYRAAHGEFSSVDELIQVAGMDQDKLEQLRPLLAAEEQATPFASEPEMAEIPDENEPIYMGPHEPDLTQDKAPEPLWPAEDEDALTEELTAYEHMEIEEEPLDPDALAGEAEDMLAEAPFAELPAKGVGSTEPEPDTTAATQPGPAAAAEPEPVGTAAKTGPDETIQPPPVAPTRAARTEPPPRERAAPRKGIGFWRGLILVLFGGLLGLVLTLLLLALLNGSLAFAPQSLVTALSRNMDTMQSNQELIWERLNDTNARMSDLEQQIARLDSLEQRIVGLEEEMEASADQLDALGTAMDNFEADLDAVGQDLNEMGATLVEVEEQITVFDGFFDALRDLLLGMQGPAEAVDE